MTRLERRQLIDTGILGVLLTVLVLVADYQGLLNPVERYLYDQRCRHCQYFTPPPTTQLIHLDIDDQSLNEIGHWPWPRTKLAQIVDELHLAGAKAVAWDVLFPEPEQNEQRLPDGRKVRVDGDAEFVESLRRFGRALIPASVRFDTLQTRSAVQSTAIAILTANPELDEADVARRVSQRLNRDVTDEVHHRFADSLREAMFDRLNRELDEGKPADLDRLRAALLPQSYASGVRSDAEKAMEKELEIVQAWRAMRRLTIPPPPGLPPMLTASNEEAPTARIGNVIAYTAFPDFLRFDDGVVRSVPLLVLDRGRLVPHMGLALACAQLGVQLKDLRLSADKIIVPRADGRTIVIPVRTLHTTDRGDLGMFMDIPWFGKPGKENEWQTAFDYPKHVESKQHMPVTRVWDVCGIVDSIIDNNIEAFSDVEQVIGGTTSKDSEELAQFRRSHPPFDDVGAWNALMAKTLQTTLDRNGLFADLADYVYKNKPNEKDWNEDQILLVTALRNLNRRSALNLSFQKQREELRDRLAHDIQGKSVIVGWVATGTVDFYSTSLYAACPGVVIHGVIFNGIMTGNLWRQAPQWVTIALTILCGLLATAAVSLLGPWKALFSAVLIIVLYLLINGIVLFDYGKMLVGSAGPVSAVGLVWTGCTLTQYIREAREKARITSRFRNYVDPSLVNYVLEHPEMDLFAGEERELTVVFTDLQGFTTVSERIGTRTVQLLNDYLGVMEPVIRGHGGYTNKFLGDGIMFFFGAPEPFDDPAYHAVAAVETVLGMQAALVPFNEQLEADGLPRVKMRAGVSTGKMVVGDAGSRQRSDYTVLGDRVNLASRLESANKATGTLVLLSDRTVELLGDRYLLRPIGRLQVVGKTEGVMTYEPLAPLSQATEGQRRCAELTRAMVDAYIAADFAACLLAANQLVAEFGESKLAGLYLRLASEYLREPPVAFAGAIRLEEK